MISVCLATYNGEPYLEEQIQSVIKQLRPEDELLISDDGSNDKSKEILERFRNHQTRIFHNNFKDPVRNFEFLLKKVSKPIVVLCDQDDIWMDHKLEFIRSELNGKKRFCIQMNAIIIDEYGNKTGQTTFEKWKSRPGFYKNLFRNTFMGSSMAFTSDLLETALPFPNKLAMHDWWIGLLAEKTAQVKYKEKPCMYYRIHNNNASLKGSSLSQKIMWRVEMMTAIGKRIKNK